MLASVLVAVLLVALGYALGRFCARSHCRRLRDDLAMASHQAEHDALTGLLNRVGARRFYDERTSAGTPLAAVLIDLDGFKAVNDTWGHQVGDAQLAAIAHRLTDACAPLGAAACRLAGDEFLLLLPDPGPHLVQAQVAAILAQVRAPLTLVAADALLADLTPAASAGVAVACPDATWAGLLQHADIALYQAKAAGGRTVLYTPGMRQPPRENIRGRRLRDSPVANYA